MQVLKFVDKLLSEKLYQLMIHFHNNKNSIFAAKVIETVRLILKLWIVWNFDNYIYVKWY